MRLVGRDRLFVLAAVVAIVGVVGLYAYASSLQARDVSIGEIGGEDIGSLVRIRGLLKDVRTASGGSVRMTVMDPQDHVTIGAFVPRDAADGLGNRTGLIPGATVSVVGEVQEYRGAVELYVASARDVTLISPAASENTEVDVLARNAEAFGGMTVSVQGIFLDPEAITDRKRYEVRDATGSIWAYVTVAAPEGGPLDAFGVLQRNEGRDRWELKVAGPQDGFYASPAAAPDGYEEVTVAQLLADPAAHEGRGVAIPGANVTRGETVGTRFTVLDEGEDDTYSVEGFIFGWDYDADAKGIRAGNLVTFVGVFDYYEEGARWQVQSDEFTLAT